MDISACLDLLLPSAQYTGAFSNQTEEEYNNIIWNDSRTKPLWSDIINTELQIIKNEKTDWLTQIHETILSQGYETQYGFKVDCKSVDIANWTAALNLLELIPSKIEYSCNELIQSGYTPLQAYTAFCQQFYIDNNIYQQIDGNWTMLEFTDFIMNNYQISVGDYDNTVPPHTLTPIQFKLMCLDVGSYYQQLYSHKWDLRNQINNASTINEVESIEW